MKDRNIIIRFSPPTSRQTNPYGTLCYEICNEHHQNIYKQMSPNPEQPQWERIQVITDDLIGVHVKLPPCDCTHS